MTLEMAVWTVVSFCGFMLCYMAIRLVWAAKRSDDFLDIEMDMGYESAQLPSKEK